MRVGASAPGKALLCGEYAVLDGAPAVVAAVDRRVVVEWSDDVEEMPPEVASTLDLARSRHGDIPGSLRIDASELRRDGIKLGLGSSAAGAVATAGAVLASHGEDLSSERIRKRVFDFAFEGHGAVAPSGSGIDVISSTFGGFQRFVRAANLEVRALPRPRGLEIRLVWTGRAARTSDLVARVQSLRNASRNRYDAAMQTLSRLAGEFVDVFEKGCAADVVRLAGDYGAAMGSLGKAAAAPIVEERLALASRSAEAHGGRAKPCGAGGGDVAIAFFADADAAHGFELACAKEGLHPIDVSFGASGVEAR